jgi:hypothetical protein
MSGDEGVKSLFVLAAWGPTIPNRDVLMITVVSGPNRSRPEIDAMTNFLRAFQSLQRVANGLSPLE